MNPEDLTKRLLRAVCRADLTECRKLLERGALPPVEVPPEQQAEAFDAMIGGSHAAEGLDLLLAWGFDPSSVRMPDDEGYQSTPFISAVRANRIDLMEALKTAGADIQWKSPTGANAATAALPSNAFQDLRRDSPDQRAVRQWLDIHGIQFDPNCREMRRQITWASYGPSSWPDVPMLIELGVDANHLKWSPFMMKIAVRDATPEDAMEASLQALSDRDRYNRTPFLLSVSAGRRDLAEALVARGADPLARGWYGATALHLAAREGHDELMEWIVDLGVPVDARDDHGGTPLDEVMFGNQSESAAMLLRLGADPNAEDENGFRIIHNAGSAEVIRLLQKAGADVNAISGGGDWPLKDACASADPVLVEYLLENGAEVNRTSTGETALFSAVASDSLECVRLLLDAGAQINVTDVDGWTCLYHVRSLPMAELLLAHGADPGLTGMFDDRPENWTSSIEVAELIQRERLKAETTGADPSEPETTS